MLTDLKMSGACKGLKSNRYESSESERGQQKGAGRVLESLESLFGEFTEPSG